MRRAFCLRDLKRHCSSASLSASPLGALDRVCRLFLFPNLLRCAATTARMVLHPLAPNDVQLRICQQDYGDRLIALGRAQRRCVGGGAHTAGHSCLRRAICPVHAAWVPTSDAQESVSRARAPWHALRQSFRASGSPLNPFRVAAHATLCTSAACCTVPRQLASRTFTFPLHTLLYMHGVSALHVRFSASVRTRPCIARVTYSRQSNRHPHSAHSNHQRVVRRG